MKTRSWLIANHSQKRSAPKTVSSQVTIQKEQIDPYIELIEKELIKLFPELEHREDNALNWAYDILNAESNAEVVETLNRVEKIITEERKETWTCNYCGKNTYNDDVEYLFGTNHIGCALEDDIKNREHSDHG